MGEAMKPANPVRAFGKITLAVVWLSTTIFVWTKVPGLIRTFRDNALSNSAMGLRDTLRVTRIQAIRLSEEADFMVNASRSDPPCTNTMDWFYVGWRPNERIVVRCWDEDLVDSSHVPGTDSLMAQAMKGAAIAAVTPSPRKVTFDRRGVQTSGNWNVYYLATGAGYRAIIIPPSGSVQMWGTDAAGKWQLLSLGD
jgi:hypothetical protein